jgi:Zn-dependent peptidase ImmA (M78 family)
MDKINLDRVVLARESRGKNQTDVAEEIGCVATNYSRIERGENALSAERLGQIANVTNYPYTFFYQAGGAAPITASIRQREKVTQKLLTHVNAQVNILRLMVQDLTVSLELDAPELPQMEITEAFTPAKAAKRLRKLWRIPEAPILNLTNHVEAHGIPVWLAELATERVDSRAILTENKYPLICIHKLHTADRQRFSLAHQLGHLVMHTAGSVDPIRDTGHEANLFAAELLMPEKEMRMAFEKAKGVTLAVLMELKRKWKVSMIALLYRADELGYLTENQKRYLVGQFNSMGIRRREPVEVDVEREQPKLIKEWMETLRVKEGLDVVGLAARLHFMVGEFVEKIWGN